MQVIEIPKSCVNAYLAALGIADMRCDVVDTVVAQSELIPIMVVKACDVRQQIAVATVKSTPDACLYLEVESSAVLVQARRCAPVVRVFFSLALPWRIFRVDLCPQNEDVFPVAFVLR